MKAILYVGHGSRVKAGVEQFEQFIHNVMTRYPDHDAFQTYGFIELSSPTIAEAIDHCVQNGATEITVVPVLLLTAGHARVDIPEQVEEAIKTHPKIRIHYRETIGVCEEVVELAVKRLEAAGMSRLVDKAKRADVDVLLVGRGSSDGYQPSDVAKIARLIYERVDCRYVETCFLAATTPTVEEGLEKVERLRSEHTVVLPYLLFTGVLMNELEQKLQRRKGGTTYTLCAFLGADHELAPVIVSRALASGGQV
ncbi:hypothetical protein DH09_19990 [Bacillaceae bacterium JMAK1]|nr:hypothetical protein DH09_19990 [Bacillaceae bacterium JMAK1]